MLIQGELRDHLEIDVLCEFLRIEPDFADAEKSAMMTHALCVAAGLL